MSGGSFWDPLEGTPQGLNENSDTTIQFGKYNVSSDMSFNILAYIVWKISPFIAYCEIRFSPTILPQGINLNFSDLHSLVHHILFQRAKFQVSTFYSL